MQIIRGLHNLDEQIASAVSIGNFDGVHLGHQKIITSLVEKSKKLGLKSILISFSPTPQQFFGKSQSTLSSFKEKHKLLENLGLDAHLLIYFNQQFGQMSAADFIKNILIKRLNIRYCLVGDDFAFGKNKSGSLDLLQEFGGQFDFVAENIDSVLQSKNRISSSKIRQFLADSNFDLAAKMLGRKFSISGKIAHGEKRGQTINFPTININIKRKISPILGVFAVEVLLQKRLLKGVANIGKRPTIGGKNLVLEVFLFDFNEQIYGQVVEVIFHHKIRDEVKFASFDDLKKQIQIDTKNAKNFFNI